MTNVLQRARKLFTSCVFALLFGFLTGCANTLLVEGEVPRPLVEPMPLNVGLHLSSDFKKYQYTENDEARSKWVIYLGEVQEDMFNTVTRGIFTGVENVGSLPPWDAPLDLDLVIAPRVDAFQYTLPSETKIKVYEVWIKYNVQVFTGAGDLLADWILTSYGKTPDGFMQTNEGALNQAIIVALRDAGANLVINFTRVPEVRTWLEQRNPTIVESPE